MSLDNRYYLEVQRAGFADEEHYIHAATQLASELSLPVVATHPVQFLEAADFKAHEVRVCIAEGYVLNDKRRVRQFTAQQYFKTQAEMAELFADLPEALANSVARCLSIETMMCRGPDGIGGDLSAALSFSVAFERGLRDFRAGASDVAAARELPQKVSALPSAWTLAGPATKSAANDIPATSAVRFIAQSPSTQMRLHPNGNLPIVNDLTSSKFPQFPGFWCDRAPSRKHG